MTMLRNNSGDNSKMILFEGAPGAGKSTLSEFIAEQHRLSGVPAEWLEEHVLERMHFVEFGKTIWDRPEDAADALLMDWDRLISVFQDKKGVVLLDGAYFGNTLKFLLAQGLPTDVLVRLIAEVDSRLKQFDPVVVYLSGDTRRIVNRAMSDRSDNWVHFIARDIEGYPYQKARGRTGIHGMTEFFVDAYQVFDRILEHSSMPRLVINTEDGNWKRAEDALLEALGLSRQVSSADLEIDVTRYVGTYELPDGFPEPFNTPFAVDAVGDTLRLHMVFYHNFHLVPQSPTHFRIRSKPWIVEFVLNDSGDATAVVYPFITEHRFVCTRISDNPILPRLQDL